MVTDDEWHFVAATYDGKTARLYVDGHLDGAADIGVPPVSIQQTLTFGGPYAGWLVDDARLYAGARRFGTGLAVPDADCDGIADGADNCPLVADVLQMDGDADGVGDLCDGCVADAGRTEHGQCGCGQAEVDTDGDGVACDPCPLSAPDDPDQDGICGTGAVLWSVCGGGTGHKYAASAHAGPWTPDAGPSSPATSSRSSPASGRTWC